MLIDVISIIGIGVVHTDSPSKTKLRLNWYPIFTGTSLAFHEKVIDKKYYHPLSHMEEQNITLVLHQSKFSKLI